MKTNSSFVDRSRSLDAAPSVVIGADAERLTESVFAVMAERDRLRNLLADVLEFLEPMEDVSDGPDGEPVANGAMSLASRIRMEVQP